MRSGHCFGRGTSIVWLNRTVLKAVLEDVRLTGKPFRWMKEWDSDFEDDGWSRELTEPKLVADLKAEKDCNATL